MQARWTRRGLAVAGPGVTAALLRFLDAALRGIGQVMLQDNGYAGLLFVAGVAWHSPSAAAAALAGSVASTGCALLCGADRHLIRQGLFGFNGALAAIAVTSFLQPGALTWSLALVAAAATTIVMAALLRLLQTWRVPVLTAPFVAVSWCFFLATNHLGRLQAGDLLAPAALPRAASVEGVVTLATLAQGLLNGIAQVFFQPDPITGIVFIAGLALASRRAAAVALAGSLVGLLLGWGLGASESALHQGAFGFNSVLVAIALAADTVGSRGGLAHWTWALLGAGAAPLVFAALSAALQPIGLSALTFPFVLVTWTFWLARPTLRRFSANGGTG